MSDLLWQKPGVTVDAEIQAFLAGDDVVLDREFFLHDIAASRAHAEGLQRIGVLTADELANLERELATLNLLTYKRVAFYPFGAGEGLLLDRAQPKWRAQYFVKKFDNEIYFNP